MGVDVGPEIISIDSRASKVMGLELECEVEAIAEPESPPTTKPIVKFVSVEIDPKARV